MTVSTRILSCRRLGVLALFLATLATQLGCEAREPAQQVGSGSPAGANPAQGAAPASPGAGAAQPAAPSTAADAATFSGAVLETMDAGGYTYVRLALEDGTERWAAGPQTAVAVGDQVRVRSSMVQENFSSPTLGRTFERIDFASALEVTPGKPAPSAVAAPAGDARRGRVLETMDAGGYTYVQIELAGGERLWAAGPQTSVAVGDEVALPAGHVMENFSSPTLGRTFGRIDFVGAIERVGAAAPAPTAADAAPTPPTAPPAVEKLPDGHTVAQIVAERTALAGTPVAVRGRIVKLNPAILGTNWIHIQDGSGDAATGTHDLTVTAPTAEGLALGDIVVVRGKVALDRDFGAGYVYPVMIEDAQVEKSPGD